MIAPTRHAYSPRFVIGYCSVCGCGESHPCHQAAPARETVVSAAETGPAAEIDLGAAVKWAAGLLSPNGRRHATALIATVEALRELMSALGEDNARRIRTNLDLSRGVKAVEAREIEMAGALKWALPLANLELESTRQIRLQAGHSDIGQGTKRLGLWPQEQEALCHARAALASTPTEALERAKAKDAASSLLHEHHRHHLQKGLIGLPDGEGGWIEIDNAAEYSDSGLYERTVETLNKLDDLQPVKEDAS